MKQKLLTVILALVLGFVTLYAQTTHNTQDAQPQPGLEYVMELRVTCDGSFSVGQTQHGERFVIPITGGTFEGPAIKGTVIPGGADYQLIDKANNRTELEAIYCIRTDDGVSIHVRNRGILKSGSGEFYFMASPTFEAPQDSKYNWLNDAIFICKPEAKQDYISLKVWKVVSS